jgi:hypothetical protein
VFTGIAAVGVAHVEACITRAHAFSVTVLVWHGFTSVTVVRPLRWSLAAR